MIMSWLGWINTHASIIVPSLAFPLGLFLMKQFMEQIPDALMEAAKIDGAKRVSDLLADRDAQCEACLADAYDSAIPYAVGH